MTTTASIQRATAATASAGQPLTAPSSASAANAAAATAMSPESGQALAVGLVEDFVHSRDATLRVDRAGAVIRGVKILGLESDNGRSYLPQALAAAVPLYEGAKVNVNHAKGHPAAPRDYQDRIGRLRGVHVRSGAGLFGDLYLNPRHALAEQLLWDATHAPENVGFSHNVQAHTVQRDGRTIVESIVAVHSVDLVADPATTRGLFEARDTNSGQGGAAVQSGDASSPPSRPSSTAPPSHAALGEALQPPLAACTLAELRAARPDLVLLLLSEEHDVRLALEARLAEVEAREAVAARRQQAVRLLREFGLPEPQPGDAAASRLVDATFFESLLAAPDERTQRAMVADRARLIDEARRFPTSGGGRSLPRSREQQSIDAVPAPPRGLREFVRAIT